MIACSLFGAIWRNARLGVLAGSALLVAPAGLVLMSSPAEAAASYVVDSASPACSDAGPGTAAEPFCTIAAGARVAQPGDTVLVTAGSYAGTSVNPARSGSPGSPITIAASPGVTIAGGAKAFALSSRSYIVISGFTISGTSSAGISASGGTNDTVTGNNITGTGSYGISISGSSNDAVSDNTESFAGTPQAQPAAGIYLFNLSGGLVQGNITHDNSAHGIYLAGSTTGVLVTGNTSYHNAYEYERNANGIDDTAPANSIIGNVTYANEDTGINIYRGGDDALVADNVSYDNGDHGIDDYDVTGGRIIGNTVYGNCTDGINVEGTSGGYAIEDNIAMNNATGGVVNPTPVLQSNGQPDYTNLCNRRVGNIGVYDSAPATSTTDYNLVWQSGSGAEYTWAGTAYGTQAALNAATGQEQHGIFANPGFVNAAAADFQLLGGSPAVDSASAAVSGRPATDILGVSPYDDRGAYEYVPGSVPVGPDAALTVSPALGTAPLTVTADAASSVAGSSPISGYTFNFGDGITVGPQPGATASHTYQAPGSYTVTVTVTDGNGLTAQATQAAAASPPMAKYVSQIATNYSTSSHSSGSVAVWRTGGVAAGDLIITTAELTGTTAGPVTATDTAGDTLSVVSDVSDGSGDRLVTVTGVAKTGLPAGGQISMSFPTAATYRIVADEVSGATALDQQAAAGGTGSTFSSGSTGIMARSGEFVFAAVASFGGTSVTWNQGWTGMAGFTVGSSTLGRAYQIPASAGTVTASGTGGGSWLAEVITFQ